MERRGPYWAPIGGPDCAPFDTTTAQTAGMTKPTNPFSYFDSSRKVIRLVVVMYVQFPLSLRNDEDLLAERGINICH